MDLRFAPRMGRFDVMVDVGASSQVGTGGLLITANVTTRIPIPTPIARCAIASLSIQGGAITGVDADGTILATFNKRDNVGAADVPLSAATSLKVDFLTAVNKNFAVPLLATLTDQQRLCQPGDIVFVNVVNNSAAIDTQPTGLFLVVEFAILQ